MAAIDAVLNYVAAADPLVLRGVQPASPAEITALQNLVPAPLPAIYREFLERMGHGMDWLAVQRADFSIEAVSRFYERPPWTPPDNMLLIARPRLDAAYDIYLTLRPEGTHRVISFPPPLPGETLDPESIYPIAGSLEEMIGTRGFRVLRMNTQPLGARHCANGDAATPEQVYASLAPLGFRKLWFSNDWNVVCEAPTAGIVAMKGVNSVLVVDWACTDEAIANLIAWQLEKTLGLEKMAVEGIWRET